MVGLHLLEIEVLTASRANALLSFVSGPLHPVVEGADIEISLLSREDIGIDAFFARHIVVRHEIGDLALQCSGIDDEVFELVVEDAPVQPFHFSPVLDESHLHPIDHPEEVGVQFIGKFNVSNLLAVYGAAIMLGKKPEDVLLVMSTLKSVNGRLDPVRSPEGFTAIVDYAHTPDALENVLNAIHEVLNGKGKVITVCGAGGNRDKGKRPLMAQEAVRQSDRVIITSDNPRFEEPQDIINDMLAGLNAQQMKKVVSIVNRREAIRTACMMAQKGDVILVAGKGHENYQEIKGVKHHFDDKEVLNEIFAQ